MDRRKLLNWVVVFEAEVGREVGIAVAVDFLSWWVCVFSNGVVGF